MFNFTPGLVLRILKLLRKLNAQLRRIHKVKMRGMYENDLKPSSYDIFPAKFWIIVRPPISCRSSKEGDWAEVRMGYIAL